MRVKQWIIHLFRFVPLTVNERRISSSVVCWREQRNAAINSPATMFFSNRRRNLAPGLERKLEGFVVLWDNEKEVRSPGNVWSRARAAVPAGQASRPGCSQAAPSEKSSLCGSVAASVTPAWPPVPAAPAAAERPGGEHQAVVDSEASPPPNTRHAPTLQSSSHRRRPGRPPAAAPSAAAAGCLPGPAGPAAPWTAWWRCEGSAAAAAPSGCTRRPPAGGGLLHQGTAAPSPASAARSDATRLCKPTVLPQGGRRPSSWSPAPRCTAAPGVTWQRHNTQLSDAHTIKDEGPNLHRQ